jgi:multidrug efflux system membrane fusion protein
VYANKLQEAEAQLVQDRAALDTAQRKLDRHQNLVQQDLISKQEWDELKAQVAKNQGQVQADQARVTAARLDVARCTIISPVEGRAGKLQIHPGNLVNTIQTQPLVVLSQVDPLVVDFTLTEREYLSLKPEHLSGTYPIEISAFSRPDERSKGTLSFADTSFETQTGLLPMRGSLPNPLMQFMPGQNVRVYLPIAVLQAAKLVPQKAVKINQQGPYVFIVKADQTVELRQVKLGEERGASVIVNEGVSPGEIVVTDGHLRLAPGLKVEIKTGPN